MELSLIKDKIRSIQGSNVILDFDLAALYGVETRALKQAVRRNRLRFPKDFMFQLTKEVWKEVITSCDNLPENVKYSPVTPFAFTEQGVAMLSSILTSQTAIDVNIAIMRTFVVIRQHLSDYGDLQERIAHLENEMNMKFKDVHQALNFLLQKDNLQTEQQNRNRIGFKSGMKQ